MGKIEFQDYRGDGFGVGGQKKGLRRVARKVKFGTFGTNSRYIVCLQNGLKNLYSVGKSHSSCLIQSLQILCETFSRSGAVGRILLHLSSRGFYFSNKNSFKSYLTVYELPYGSVDFKLIRQQLCIMTSHYNGYIKGSRYCIKI